MHTAAENVIVMGNNTEGPRKFESRTAMESAYLLVDIHPKKLESSVKEMLEPVLTAALFTSATVGNESRHLSWTNKHILSCSCEG